MTFAAAAARATASTMRILGDTQAVLDNVRVAGIFDNGYASAADGMASRDPTFMLPTARAARVRQGSTLRIVDGSTYRVTNMEPDGTGVTTLQLELQP